MVIYVFSLRTLHSVASFSFFSVNSHFRLNHSIHVFTNLTACLLGGHVLNSSFTASVWGPVESIFRPQFVFLETKIEFEMAI